LLLCLGITTSYAQNDSINNKNNEQVDESLNQNIEILSEQLQAEDGDLSSLTD